ncbi:MAG: DUF2192 domain-containing protein [Candidatus Obscuribacterales bacterium]|jgi:hypothetical protein|nr:DUF2192 domain-containing protein [Candidatus Obscuribacterales bacterium]
MNLFKTLLPRSPLSVVSALALVSLLSLGQGSLSDEASDTKYDYVIEFESKPMEGFLKYKDSKLGNFYKIVVHSTDTKTKEKVKYQDMYVCSKVGEKPALVGIRRFAALQKEMKKKMVAIQIKFSKKSPAQEEVVAVSYGVPPVLVDLRIDNFAGAVAVPIDSFFAFKEALNTQGFQASAQVSAAGEQTSNRIPLDLASEPKGRYEGMVYFPSVKKK